MITQFGKYLLLKKIATGGMADIFLAKQTGLAGFEKLVVVKRILSQLSTEREFVQMFLDEARLAASLSHPNVVQIYDLGQVQDSYFIAMEFIAGQDLLAIIRKARKGSPHYALPPALAARIIAGACEGLHYAHTRNDKRGQPLKLVHRDVSPSNILVSYEGGVKVVDFGIAKAESQSSKTQAGTLKGKFAYMSPEQIRAEPVDARSDIFGLGVVLHEALTGRRLFKRDTELAIINTILEGEVRPPSALRPEVPKALDAICLKALEKDSKRRYPSARAMQQDLERYLASTADPPGSAHVAEYMMASFADEYASYQRLLSELPTAELDQLVELIAEHTRHGVSGSGSSLERLPPDSDGPEPVLLRKGGRRAAIPVAILLALLALVGALGYALINARSQAPGAVVAASGEVALETDPPGASVFLGERQTSLTTPCVLKDLAFDQDHKVRVELPGHAPREVAVRLSSALPSKSVSLSLTALAAAPGELQITTDPPGASVFVDGRRLGGDGPSYVAPLAPDLDHVVRAALEGHLDEAVSVRVTPGEKRQLALTLRPREPEARRARQTRRSSEFGELALKSQPSAEVFAAGKSLGNTPLVAKLPAGQVELQFVNAAVDLRQTLTLSVPARDKAAHEVVFKKGKLAAEVHPWADVYLGERKLGTTPIAPKDVYEGKYTLRLVNSELGAIKTLTVEVRAGRTTVVREKLE